LGEPLKVSIFRRYSGVRFCTLLLTLYTLNFLYRGEPHKHILEGERRVLSGGIQAINGSRSSLQLSIL